MFTKWWTVNLSPLSRSAKVVAFALLSSVIFAVAGCSILPKEDEEEVLPPINPPKLSQKPEYVVKTTTLETKVRGTGRLWATKEEELFFVEDGKRIKEVYVSPGDRVEAGQLLMELDVSDQESQLRRKQLQARQDELTIDRKSVV